MMSVAFCGLVTSCYPPYPPSPYDRPVPTDRVDPAQRTATVGDDAQRQLEEARRRLEQQEAMGNAGGGQAGTNVDPTPTPNPTPGTYQYADPVPGKAGYVFNPYTKNQVDVRGIPSGTLVRDPHDPNPAHKFRVP